MLIGYARVSTDAQDPARQLAALTALGVEPANVHTDHATGRTADRPGLTRALAIAREGDSLVVSALDRLGRSVPDLRGIADYLADRGVRLVVGGTCYDPGDPVGRMFFGLLAVFAEFESDLIRARTREGMAVARAAGRLTGGTPKLAGPQRAALLELHATGRYTAAQLAASFHVSRSTVFRVLSAAKADPLTKRVGHGPAGTLALAYEDA